MDEMNAMCNECLSNDYYFEKLKDRREGKAV